MARVIERLTGWFNRVVRKQPAAPPPEALPPGDGGDGNGGDDPPPPPPTRSQRLAAWALANKRTVALGSTAVLVLVLLGVVRIAIWATRTESVVPSALSFTWSGPDKASYGTIDVRYDLDVFFRGSPARLDLVGKELTTGVTLEPAMPGSWTWVNDHHLRFAPQKDWPLASAFNVKFDKSIFSPFVELDRYEWSFTTAPFNASIANAEFHQDPTNPAVKKVVVTLRFSHSVDPSSLESRISLKNAEEKGVDFTVSYDENRREAYIHSETIEIPPEESHVDFAVREGVVAQRGGNGADNLSTRVRIPGLFNFFRIDSASLDVVDNERYEPEHVWFVNSSATALESQMGTAVTACVLPKDFPAIEKNEAIPDHSWSDYDLQKIGPAILAACKKTPLTLIPTDREHSNLFAFRAEEAKVGQFVLLRVAKGTQSYGGYVLAKEFQAIRQVPHIATTLRILHDGAVLSLKGERKLTFLSRGLDSLQVEVGRVLPDRVNHLVSQTQGDFKSIGFGRSSSHSYYDDYGDGYSSSSSYGFGEYDVSERFESTFPLVNAGAGKPQYTAFDLGDRIDEGKRGLFFVSVKGGGLADRRFVLVTDLGLLVKDSTNGTHDVFVQSISDGRPVSGATVEILGRNGVAIATKTTDSTGHAAFDSVAGFRLEKEPTAWVVRTPGDLSFLPYKPRDRMLDVSRFDIGGLRGELSAEGLSAYLFSDRGLYRPGDEVRVGLIVKHPDWSKPLSGVPVEIAVRDARGVEFFRKPMALSADGFDEIRFSTEEASPTGTYDVTAYVVRPRGDRQQTLSLGSLKVRIEEFQPDRMRMTAGFTEANLAGWVKPDGLSARVHLENLFGTAAEGRRIEAGFTLSPAYPQFAEWKGWRFHDPLKPGTSYTEELDEGSTSGDGDATFPLGLERLERATYNVAFTATGYELEGGRGVTAAATALVSPLDYLVGWKSDADLGYLRVGGNVALDVVAIGPDLKRVPVEKLQRKLLEVKYVSALLKQPNGTYRYESVRKEVTIATKELALTDKGGRIVLPTDKAGSFVVVVQDAGETELLRVPFTVAGAANLTRDLDRNAELTVRLSKPDYGPGEEIELEIRAPYTGSGLVTIEREKVYAWTWFKADTNVSVQKIRVPAELEGNAYVSVSFLRAPDSPEIYMSPLSFGVVPFSISRERRDNKIDLEVAGLARPGEKLAVKYKTARPGRIVLFAIDEGILQVAGYKTPAPLDHYFRKRALEVRTLQILDLVLPEYSLSKRASGTGGDEEAVRAALARNLNPFRRKSEPPIAFWSGVLDSGTDFKQLEWQIPDYFNGTVRLMAVAVASDSMGVAAQPVIVRGPFVINPNVPTQIAPGDEFTGSVTLANNVEGSGKDARISLEVTVTGPLEVVGDAKKTMSVPEAREGSEKFTFRGKGEPGAASIKFVAKGANKEITRTSGIAVRPATTYMTDVVSGQFEKGNVDVPTPRRMLSSLRTLEVSASPLPLSLAPGLVKYLEEYPYGCSEQIVSKAFPALVLKGNAQFGRFAEPKRVQSNLDHVITTLRGRQNDEGAFGFWAANSHVNDFQVVYAMHFLTEAKQSGEQVPPDMFAKGLAYVKQVVTTRGVGDHSTARLHAYGWYVLARNGAADGNDLAGFRKKLDGLKKWENDVTALYLASAHAVLRQDKLADALAAKVTMSGTADRDYATFYDSTSRNGQVLYLFAKHFPDRTRALTSAQVSSALGPLLTGGFNTISSAYSLLALDAYVDLVGTHGLHEVKIDEVLAANQLLPVVLPKEQLFPKVEFSERAEKIRFSRTQPAPTFWQVTQAGFDAAMPKAPIANKIEIVRELRNAQGQPVTEAELGDELTVHVKLRTVANTSMVPYIAVVDLLPGGFEVVPNTTREEGSSEGADVTHEESSTSEDGYSEEGGDYEGGDGYEGEGSGENESPDLATTGGGDAYWTAGLAQPGTTWYPEYADVREDRVVLYGSATSNVREFVYRVRATTRGKFVVPPPFAEAMYDRDIRARGLSSTMEVK